MQFKGLLPSGMLGGWSDEALSAVGITVILSGLATGFVRALRPKVLIFYCLATNDNKDPPCLRVMAHIHLNWCLEGCTGWRWMQSHLVQVPDRRTERERQAMFWHTWLENHPSGFSISEEKAACRPLCASKKAQGWVWSGSAYVGWKSHLSRKKKKSVKDFLLFWLIRWFSERLLNHSDILVYVSPSWCTKASLWDIAFVFLPITLDVICQSCFVEHCWQVYLSAGEIIGGNCRSNFFTSAFKSMPPTARRDW